MIDSIVRDGSLFITPHDSNKIQDLKEATALNVDKITVGVENPDEREILKDQETELNYSRNAVESQELYDRNKNRHRPWFFLELCTGKYGWYPGCEIHADVVNTPVQIKSEPSDISDTLYEIDMPSIVVILDQDALDKSYVDTGWYRINYLQEGYIKSSCVKNLRYADPNTSD